MTPVTVIFKAERSDTSLMAKKGRRRNDNFFVHKDSPQNGLSTLASDAVKLATAPTLSQDVLILSVDTIHAIRDLTPGEGPIEFGVADASLSTTEIAECLDASPAHKNDVPAVEQAARKVRSIGMFGGELAHEKFNEGRPRRVKLNWRVPASQSFPNFWVRNRSGATLTTGAIVELNNRFYCIWKF